jgi:hypothetical protein
MIKASQSPALNRSFAAIAVKARIKMDKAIGPFRKVY